MIPLWVVAAGIAAGAYLVGQKLASRRAAESPPNIGQVRLKREGSKEVAQKTWTMHAVAGGMVAWHVENQNADLKRFRIHAWQPYNPLDREIDGDAPAGRRTPFAATVRADALPPGQNQYRFLYRIVVDGQEEDPEIFIRK